MWIERISISNFQAFDAATVEFAPGLNVVGSPNEGGKSSLFRAIVTALFADASSRSADTRAFARWGSEGLFRLEMGLRIGDSGYRIVKDFQSREQAVYTGDGVEPLAKGKAVGEFLRSRLPLPDENLFLRVCGVRHEELSSVCDGEVSIGEKLEEILGGGWGEATPDRIAQTLEAKRAELLRGVDRPALEKNWGLVKRLREAIVSGERDLAEAVAAAARREECLRALSIIGSGIEGLDGKLALLEEKTARAKQRADTARKVDEARKKAESLRKQMDRVRELRSRREAQEAKGETFPASLRGIDAGSIAERRRELDREGSLEGDRAREAERRRRVPAGTLILAAALIVAGVVGGLLWNRFLFSAAGLGGALLLVFALRGAAMGRPALLREKGRELAALSEKRRLWAGERSLEGAAKLLDDFSAWEAERRQLDVRLDEAIGGRAIDGADAFERLDAGYGAASRELRGLEEELRELEPFDLGADALIELGRETNLTKRDRENLGAERAAKERSLAALPAIDGNEIREGIESAREALGCAERTVAIIDVILEALGEARSQMSGFLAGKLPPLAAGYLSRITDGRYRTLFIDPVRLRVETIPAEGDVAARAAAARPERIGPETLSQGARDQIHVAVRLALVNLMSGAEPQPLFLDDPFVHFDPERRRRALELVTDFARLNQVILFTCDPGYRDLGGRFIDLERCRATR